MDRDPAYDEPYLWWGPGWRAEGPRSLAALVEAQTLSLPAAGLLAAAVRQGRSLAVVAVPSGAGKTTLLNALLPWIPGDHRRFYLRGSYEPFAFLRDPAVDPQTSTLLCNEISPHLPAYLWGDGVARLLAARQRGFQVLATAHAADALGFVRLLTGPPLRIAAAAAAGFDLVVAVEFRGSGLANRRAVAGIWALGSSRVGSIEVVRLGDADSTLADLAAASPALLVADGMGRLDADVVAAVMVEIAADRRAAAAGELRPGPKPHQYVATEPGRPRRDRPNG